MTTNPRPQFSRSEIVPKNHWILREIPDVNADAMDATCYSCEAPLSWAQWLNATDAAMQIRCHGCQSYVFTDGASNPVPQETHDAVQEPGYFDRTWYHVSRERNWAKIVRKARDGDLIVHAGSKLSALSRADDLSYEEEGNSAGPYYLHSFRLRSTRRFGRSILEDMVDSWQTTLSKPVAMDLCAVAEHRLFGGTRPTEELSPEGYHGAPYYNRYEVPGDISLLFHARLIQLNTVETVELKR